MDFSRPPRIPPNVEKQAPLAGSFSTCVLNQKPSRPLESRKSICEHRQHPRKKSGGNRCHTRSLIRPNGSLGPLRHTVAMDQLLTDNVWREASNLLKTGDRKLAAIAYVTSNLHLSFATGDVLVCDASDTAIKSGETSADLLKTLFAKSVQLHSCPGLHAKTLVSSELAIVGSSNLSLSSANHLIEASLLTRRFQVRSQVRAFIQKLIAVSTPIDGDFITRALGLPVTSRPRTPTRAKRMVERPANRTWIVSTVPLGETIHEREGEFEEAGEQNAKERMTNPEGAVSWIRWAGRSRFRAEAKEGDSIIELECNKQRTRCRAIQPRPIILRQDSDKWTRFYLEDPPEWTYFPWRTFEIELRRVGLQSIKKNATRELQSREVGLMELIWGDDDSPNG